MQENILHSLLVEEPLLKKERLRALNLALESDCVSTLERERRTPMDGPQLSRRGMEKGLGTVKTLLLVGVAESPSSLAV